jgi:hypothetical protein
MSDEKTVVLSKEEIEQIRKRSQEEGEATTEENREKEKNKGDK